MTTSTLLAPPAATRTERRIGQVLGRRPGPTLICCGSMHGNEPAGYHALKKVFAQLENRRDEIRGEFLGLVGNRAALAAGRRFLAADLNRHWSAQRVVASRTGALAESPIPEDHELHQLRQEMEEAFGRARGPAHLVDLHTTSSDSPAFVVMADTLRNREFALQFPSPIILGLEEELEGTMTDYVMNLGHVAMGFEGGRHDDPASIDLCEAAIWIALVAAEVLDAAATPELEPSQALLERISKGLPRVFEVRYRHPVQPEDGFVMEPGFASFQAISTGQLLA
ncbi:MAG: succinylglutamate desuccinylase/aspartoacylase family protein, partial [Acidobacteria bacterium]|nr:succinylglutamate desuccinylase/aspartoacylase family protein [Acidobacteriota bacterium]